MHSIEHKQISSGSVVPPLSPKYPWSVAQNLEAEEAHTFFNLHDPLSHYRCKIPELLGKCIRGCFFGCWALLSSNRPRDVTWSLWNPITSEIINLPPLNHRGLEADYDDIRYCCMSAPPDHPSSVLLLTRTNKRNLVYCRLGSDSSFPNTRRKKELRWTEMTYAKQVRSITSFDDAYLYSLTSCNGRVYAYLKVSESNTCPLLVEIKMLVKYRKRKNFGQVVITFLPILEFRYPTTSDCRGRLIFLEGSSTELFTIVIGVKDKTSISVVDVKLFKLNMNNKVWEEMDDLKETIISVGLLADGSTPVFATHAIVSSESGGYIHILGGKGNILYSYHVKDQTISVSFIPCVAGTNHVSSWPILECTRLEDDHAHLKQEKDKGDEIVVRSVKGDHEVEINNKKDGSRLLNSTFCVLKMIIEFCAGVDCLPLSCVGYESRLENDHSDSKQEKDMDDDILVQSINGDEDESPLLNIPLHVLETVMEFCVGVEYLKFRSTCKLCHLAAPLMQCKNGKALEMYSLLSPWLMVFDKHKGIITFTDPMFGDKYFIKTPQSLIGEYFEIKCSRYGWLLILKSDNTMLFFNPFTSDIRTLPQVPSTDIFSFSAPPTSPDCMVVALIRHFVFIHFVAGEQSWDSILLDYIGDDHKFFTLYGLESLDLYAMKANGGLDIYKEMGGEYYCWERTECQAPTSCCTSLRQSFLVRCEERGFLQIIVGEFGESVEVFELNDTTQEWVKMDSLGKHMIFISSASPICIKANIPEMENKIYFPRLSSPPKGNIVFYSLETCRYHTFNNKDIQENFGDFFGTRYLAAPHAWIEPNWC